MPIPKNQPEGAEDHIPLPESSDEDDDSSSELSGDEHKIEDPFYEEKDSDLDASDSDDAPETLSFQSAQENLKAQQRKTIEVLKIHKEEKRRKRKELHDQYMLQKEEKRQKIDGKLLPKDVLEELNDHPELEAAKNEEGNDKEEKEKIDTEVKEEIVQNGPTLFKCKSLAEEDKKRKHMPENVKTFKDRLLYGDRIRREKSNKDANAKRKKQLVSASYRSKNTVV